MNKRLSTRGAWIRIGAIAGLATAAASLVFHFVIRMPGQSYRGPFEPLSSREQEVREQLRRDVHKLAGEIGERNSVHRDALDRSAEYVRAQLTEAGYQIERQQFEFEGQPFENIAAQLNGNTAASQIVVVGAHYDSAIGTPGANDNGSGVAAMLALARAFANKPQARTLRFVAFVNEEPPFYYGEGMGSLQYARRCRAANDDIVAMMSLETMGYFSSAPGSQSYPAPGLGIAYPTTGDFIALVGNLESRNLVTRTAASFREHARFPSEASALPGKIPGVGWSDHWSFWQAGYEAIMITDTAPFRYAHYHHAEDTPDKVKYDELARVVVGLEAVLRDLSAPAE